MNSQNAARTVKPWDLTLTDIRGIVAAQLDGALVSFMTEVVVYGNGRSESVPDAFIRIEHPTFDDGHVICSRAEFLDLFGAAE